MLYFLDRQGFLSPVRLVSDWLTLPARRFFFSTKSPRVEGELMQKNRELSVIWAENKILREENLALKKQLEKRVPPERQYIVAHPVGLERYLVIDRGESDGVKKDNTVVADGVLVGKVVQVAPHSASIQLPTDPDAKIPAWTSSLTRGLVTGSFGRTIVFEKVLQADPLVADEVVLTTGEEGYVQNIAIGKVRTVSFEPRAVYKKGELVPLIDYQRLRVVFVISE